MVHWKKTVREHWVVLRFGPLLVFLVFLSFLLIAHRFFSSAVPVEDYFTCAVAKVSGVALDLAGFPNAVEGTRIIPMDEETGKPGPGLDLRTGCNGLVAVIVFLAAILAFPSTWKEKLFGFLLGLVVIQGFNVIRIGVLYYLHLHQRKLFDMVHIYVAQSILIVLAAALWLFWSARCSGKPRPRRA